MRSSNTGNGSNSSGCRWLLTGCALVVGIIVFGFVGLLASFVVLAPVPEFEPVEVPTSADADCTQAAARAYRAEWMALSDGLGESLIPDGAESIDDVEAEAMRDVAEALSALEVPACLEPLRDADAALYYDVSDKLERGRDGRGPRLWRQSLTMYRLIRSIAPHIEHANAVKSAIEDEYGFTFSDEEGEGLGGEGPATAPASDP